MRGGLGGGGSVLLWVGLLDMLSSGEAWRRRMVNNRDMLAMAI